VEIQDGAMVHIGRLDRQLKVRGYRIEPEEIEASLRKHSSVTDAVITTAPGSGGLSLVAFVVGDRDSEAALRTHLASCLPRHLMPSRIVWVDELPTNARGKVDHKRLAALAAEASATARASAT
jgi:acyl-coenzyme A synthetase/AMP-(fatty) acid ligase